MKVNILMFQVKKNVVQKREIHSSSYLPRLFIESLSLLVLALGGQHQEY